MKIKMILHLLAVSPLLVSFDVLLWNANIEDDLAGYKVYWGNESRFAGENYNYQFMKNVGNQTEYDLATFDSGEHYLAVTAYDQAGNESQYSAEVYWNNTQQQSAPDTIEIDFDTPQIWADDTPLLPGQVSHYNVYLKRDGIWDTSPLNILPILPSGTDHITWRQAVTLNYNTDYSVVVTAYGDKWGSTNVIESVPSPAVVFNTGRPPIAPGQPTNVQIRFIIGGQQ